MVTAPGMTVGMAEQDFESIWRMLCKPITFLHSSAPFGLDIACGMHAIFP